MKHSHWPSFEIVIAKILRTFCIHQHIAHFISDCNVFKSSVSFSITQRANGDLIQHRTVYSVSNSHSKSRKWWGYSTIDRGSGIYLELQSIHGAQFSRTGAVSVIETRDLALHCAANNAVTFDHCCPLALPRSLGSYESELRRHC